MPEPIDSLLLETDRLFFFIQSHDFLNKTSSRLLSITRMSIMTRVLRADIQTSKWIPMILSRGCVQQLAPAPSRCARHSSLMIISQRSQTMGRFKKKKKEVLAVKYKWSESGRVTVKKRGQMVL